MNTTTDTITTDQIQALENEATEAGDLDMAATCRLALYGATEEIRDATTEEVVEAIRSAEAMADTFVCVSCGERHPDSEAIHMPDPNGTDPSQDFVLMCQECVDDD